MKYFVDFTDEAQEDMRKLRKSGDKQAVKKLDKLLVELECHPRSGEGKPERLKHCIGDVWSREITRKHRLVYEIIDNTVYVEVAQAWGHYNDK